MIWAEDKLAFWVRMLLPLVGALLGTVATDILLRVLEPALRQLGIPRVGDSIALIIAILVFAMIILMVMIYTALRPPITKELPLKDEVRREEAAKKSRHLSPLKTAAGSNLVVLIAVILTYPYIPIQLFWAIVVVIFMNTIREFFTVHYATREQVEKLINEIIHTFHQYCNNAAVVALPGRKGMKVRVNMMVCDHDRKTLHVIRSKGMDEFGDKDAVIAVTSGVAGRAFCGPGSFSRAAQPWSEMGFSEQESAKFPPNLRWIWSHAILRPGGKTAVGVLNADLISEDDVTTAPLPEALKVTLATFCQDFATFLSLAYHLNPHL